MSKKLKTINRICLLVLGAITCFCAWRICEAEASTMNYYVSGNSYELVDGTDFKVIGSSKSTLCFKQKSIGSLTVKGNISKATTYEGYDAYGALDGIVINYLYNGSFQTKDKEVWNLTTSDSKIVNGISLDKKVNNGAIIVQSSTDGRDWSKVYSETDIFDEKKGLESFYQISLDDVKKGAYYRVTIAYRMRQKVAENKNIIGKSDVYQYKEFVENYEFYVCYGGNAVEIRDVSTGKEAGATVKNAFIVDKHGTNCSVTVSKNGGIATSVDSLTTVTEPGNYKICISNNLGQTYEIMTQILDGLDLKQILPIVYDGEASDKYEATNAVASIQECSMPSLTKLKIGCQNDSELKITNINGYPAYGVNGDSVVLFLQLAETSDFEEQGWKLDIDEYGKKETEKIEGIQTGEVATGAFFIQKSFNGTDWEDVDSSKYAQGLYTTDFYTHYGDRGDVNIYTPGKTELNKGIYLRVGYAYRLKKEGEKSYNRYLEMYEFYLCNNNLGGITFPNLTLEDNLETVLGDANETQIEMFRHTQTIESGHGTVTGFSVNKNNIDTIKCSVKRDGTDVAIPSNGKFTVTGRYDISLESVLGDKRDITLYIDGNTPEEALKVYFGESFIRGKRIYAEDAIPVFESGNVTYHLEKVSDSYLPVYGTISHSKNGVVVELDPSREERTGELTEPGIYTAEFRTGENKEGELSGDVRVFTFNFRIVENGTAPGPVVNQKNLEVYAKTCVSDAYPVYYGYAYESQNKGQIVSVSKSYEAAYNSALKFQSGLVEIQEDGTYLYDSPHIDGNIKDIYVSIDELNKDIEYTANRDVQPFYFDITQKRTCQTLKEGILETVIEKYKSPRFVELCDSIVIFEDGQKELLTDVDAFPFISKKPYYYVYPSVNGVSSYKQEGFVDFEFIKDVNGYDSASVKITDCNGKVYDIEYNKGVGEQLDNAGCPSGIVTITEGTIYGDEVSYQAVYIRKGDNTATATISYYENDTLEKITLSKEDNGCLITADYFILENVVDDLDPYSLVRVTKDGKDNYFECIDTLSKKAWVEPGLYQVRIVNRLGGVFVFDVEVSGCESALVILGGEGTENVDPIMVPRGMKIVDLPVLSLYGYDLVGYQDEKGTIYTEHIALENDPKPYQLNAVWKPKTVKIEFQKEDGTIIETQSHEFGTEVFLDTTQEWYRNNALVEGETLLVDSESKIVLVCKNEESKSEIREDETSVTQSTISPEETKAKNAGVWIALGIFGIVGLGGIFAVFCCKRKRLDRKAKEE